MQKKINSPLKPGAMATKVDSFEAKLIVRKYQEIGLDVSRFFLGLEEIDLYKCETTGYRFYYPFEAIGDAEFYNDLSKNRSNYYSDRWEHDRALQNINKDDLVLEIGSGFGAFLNRLDRTKTKARGLELNPHAVETCQATDLDVEDKLIEQEATERQEYYDVVCSFQVLEHITNVFSFIDACVKLLKPGGKLIIGVPNNNPFLHINDKYHTLNLPPHHAGLWDKKSLISLRKIFPLENPQIEFEPLELSYDYFIRSFIENQSSKLIKRFLFRLKHSYPLFLRKILCEKIIGRNVLMIYTKAK
jgi:SAM-dependent methyltransferase